MSGDSSKEKAASLNVAPGSGYAKIKKLIAQGFLDRPVSSAEIVRRIRETCSEKWPTSRVQIYMKRFLSADIVHAVKPRGETQNYWVLADVPREQALKQLGKNRRIEEIEEELFSRNLTKRLRKNFHQEIHELRDNFGRNGNCTAFLLRKILEKLILIVFGKHNKQALLSDPARPGGWKGLKEIIEIAAREKVQGIPFLTPKTANEIKGIKFLGDTAAHNPLVGVENATILPQMAFIITAYEELAKRLSRT